MGEGNKKGPPRQEPSRNQPTNRVPDPKRIIKDSLMGLAREGARRAFHDHHVFEAIQWLDCERLADEDHP